MLTLDPRRFWIYGVFLIVALSTFPFISSLSGTPVWDDHDLLSGKSTGLVKGIKGAFTEPFMGDYFRPVVALSFHVRDASPFFHHLTNLLIHLATVVVVVALAWRLFKDRSLALLSGAFFGVQPVQVSTVAWIGGRTDSLSALFVSLFFYFLVTSFNTKYRSWCHVCGALSLLFAMGCKEQAAILLLAVPPVAFILGNVRPKELGRWLPMFGLYFSVCAAFGFGWYLSGIRSESPVINSLAQTADLFGRTVWHYVSLVFVPTPAALHTFSLGRSRELGVWPALAGIAAFVAFVVLLAKTHIRKSAVFLPLFSVFLTALPVMNLLAVPSLTVAPYRIGVAGPSFAVCLSLLAVALFKKSRPLGIALTAAVLVYSTALTAWGGEQWRSEKSLFANIVKYDPASSLSVINFSISPEVKDDEAIQSLTAALNWIYGSNDWKYPEKAATMFDTDAHVQYRMNVDANSSIDSRAALGKIFLVLGTRTLSTGDTASGASYLRTSTLISPASVDGWSFLAMHHFLKGEIDSASAMVDQAIRIAPKNHRALITLGLISDRKGDTTRAEQSFRHAINVNPSDPQGYALLSRSLALRGMRIEALATIEQAVRANAITADAVQGMTDSLPSKQRSSQSLNKTR